MPPYVLRMATRHMAPFNTGGDFGRKHRASGHGSLSWAQTQYVRTRPIMYVTVTRANLFG